MGAEMKIIAYNVDVWRLLSLGCTYVQGGSHDLLRDRDSRIVALRRKGRVWRWSAKMYDGYRPRFRVMAISK